MKPDVFARKLVKEGLIYENQEESWREMWNFLHSGQRAQERNNFKDFAKFRDNAIIAYDEVTKRWCMSYENMDNIGIEIALASNVLAGLFQKVEAK